MTQDEKDLIFKDLCGRLSYGVKLRNTTMADPTDIGSIVRLYSIDLDEYYCKIMFYTYEGKALCVSNEGKLFKVGNRDVDFLRYKPYLFPLSNMTDEQKAELIKYAKSQSGKVIIRIPARKNISVFFRNLRRQGYFFSGDMGRTINLPFSSV